MPAAQSRTVSHDLANESMQLGEVLAGAEVVHLQPAVDAADLGGREKQIAGEAAGLVEHADEFMLPHR